MQELSKRPRKRKRRTQWVSSSTTTRVGHIAAKGEAKSAATTVISRNGDSNENSAASGDEYEYYHGADQAKMAFVLDCQQALRHEADRNGFVSAWAYTNFLYEYCKDRDEMSGPNCSKDFKHDFDELPQQIQDVFLLSNCNNKQDKLLECEGSDLTSYDEDDPFVSEWMLFGVCYPTFELLEATGLLATADSGYSNDESAPRDSDRNDENNHDYGWPPNRLKMTKSKRQKGMMRNMATGTASPSTSHHPAHIPSRMPTSAPTRAGPSLRPSRTFRPSVSPGPTSLPTVTRSPSAHGGSSTTKPAYPPPPSSAGPQKRPTVSSDGNIPSGIELPDDNGTSRSRQAGIGAGSASAITFFALLVPILLILAVLYYRRYRSRLAAMADASGAALNESNSIESEDSNLLDGHFARSPKRGRSPRSSFELPAEADNTPPIEEISPERMGSFERFQRAPPSPPTMSTGSDEHHGMAPSSQPTSIATGSLEPLDEDPAFLGLGSGGGGVRVPTSPTHHPSPAMLGAATLAAGAFPSPATSSMDDSSQSSTSFASAEEPPLYDPFADSTNIAAPTLDVSAIEPIPEEKEEELAEELDDGEEVPLVPQERETQTNRGSHEGEEEGAEVWQGLLAPVKRVNIKKK